MLLQISKICIISIEKEPIMNTEAITPKNADNIMDAEYVVLRFDNDTQTVLHTPRDFISYICIFWQYKSIHIEQVVAQLKNYEDLKKIAQNKRSTKKAAEAIEKLKAISESDIISLVDELGSELEKYGINKSDKTQSQKIPLSILNQEQPINDFSERPIFNELFDGQLWSVFEYLQNVNGFENLLRTLKQLVVDTVHHYVPNIQHIAGLDLPNYQKEYQPSKKVSKLDIEYGKYLLSAAATYATLRAMWLQLYVNDYNLAKHFESAVVLSARLGHDYHNFRYAINCGSGGSTKSDKHFAEARTLLHEYYLKLYKKEISRNALVNEMYSSEKKLVFSPEYEALAEAHKNLMNEKTISKYIKQWDKENGIDRTKFKKSTKPRIKTMVG